MLKTDRVLFGKGRFFSIKKPGNQIKREVYIAEKIKVIVRVNI